LKRSILLASAYLLDQIAGDPEWFPHPVRLIGFAAARGEAALRRPNQPAAIELTAGAALTAAIVTGAWYFTAAAIRESYRRSALFGNAMELLLGWTCIAARNLQQETTAVTNCLAGGDILLARQRLARVVGRDTEGLDGHEISRAVIEAAAESASDGIVAPLFYMALGGVPLAVAYKAINTLDSIIGHTNSRYLCFGKAAARLDDAANFLPARLTALGIVAASRIVSEADAGAAWRTWQRDGSKHKSPNAGQPESAMGGALHVRLGGANTYGGELVPAQLIGAEFRVPTPKDAKKAIRLVSVVALLCAGLAVLFTAAASARKFR
jgi:adenosylcobinamide-phosphate synthase